MAKPLPLDMSFQPRRAWRFAVYLAAFQGPRAAVTAGVLTAAFAVLTLAASWGGGFGRGEGAVEVLWILCFTAVAWVTAAGTFTDTRRAARASRWFLIPASLLEKYVVSTLVPALFLAGGMPLVALLSDGAARLLSLLFWGRASWSFDLLSPGYWWTVASTMALVPVFYYGSVAFRVRPLLKTLLALFAALFVVVGLVTGLGWLFFSGNNLTFNDGQTTWGSVNIDPDPTVLIWVFGALYFAMVPLFFLAAGFLRLSEREVDDGVS